MAFSELLLQRVPSDSVFVPLKSGRHGVAKFLHKPLHGGGKLEPTTRRQLQSPRSLRILEIVDVAPVGWRGLGSRLVPQQVFDHRVPAGARRAKSIDVVSLAAHPERKIKSLDGTLLPDQPRGLFEFAANHEGQLGRIAAAVEQLWRQRPPQVESPLARNRAGSFASLDQRRLCHLSTQRPPSFR